MNYLSSNIKFLRQQKKLTQEDVAKVVGKVRSLISAWESDERDISVEDIIKLSEFFNISMESLVGTDLRLQNKETNKTYTTTIYTDDEYKLQLQTDKPFDTLSEEEKEKLIQQAMDELFEYKRSLKNNK